MCSYSDRMLSGAIHRYPLPYTTTHPMAGRHCPPLTIDGTSPLTDHTTTGRPLLLHPDPDSVTIDDTVDRVTVRGPSATRNSRPPYYDPTESSRGQPAPANRSTPRAPSLR
jgi:hypothetical protein